MAKCIAAGKQSRELEFWGEAPLMFNVIKYQLLKISTVKISHFDNVNENYLAQQVLSAFALWTNKEWNDLFLNLLLWFILLYYLYISIVSI